jgi:hypothetical protein
MPERHAGEEMWLGRGVGADEGRHYMAHPAERRDTQVSGQGRSSWSVEDRIKLTSVLATSAIAIASLVVSTLAQRSANRANQTVDASRVETAWVTSNSNGRGTGDAWQPWVYTPDETTVYIGLRRNIVFAKPFTKVPSVSTAFSLIDTESLDNILPGLGDKKIDKDTSARLHQIHVITDTDAVNERSFDLLVGIGMPTTPGQYLRHVLSTTTPDAHLVERMKGMGQLDARHSNLDPAESWMVNFFNIVGTINVSWIAQASEK